MPVFLMEAMACGVAVNVTRTGLPKLLGDGAALLAQPRPPQALAAALESLAEHLELRRELGARGRMRVEEASAVDPIVTALRARLASFVAESKTSVVGSG